LSRYGNGFIDDVRIYNRALSASEVESLYNGQYVDSDGLVGHWAMNEGEGGTVADLSGNGNDGTIYGATWTTDRHEATEDRILTCQKTDTETYEWVETAPNWRKSVADTLTEGLVGHWTFNETETNFAYDYSGQGNTGRSFGPYLEFSGLTSGDNVNIGDIGDPQMFSVSFWVNPYELDIDANNNYRRIISCQSADNFILIEQAGGLSFRVPGVSTANYCAGIIKKNYFNHGTVVYNQEDRIIYINGSEVGRQTIGSGTVNFGGGLYIGTDKSGQGLSGIIDDVRIYNRALSATEIEQLYEGRFNDTTGLVGHWKMDEMADGTCAGGLDVCDHSGNENHGDNVGATWQTGTAPTRTTTGSGQSATFDGIDDYVEVGNLGTLYDQGTISFWMNPSVIESHRNPFTTKYAGSNAAIRFEENVSGQFRVFIGNDVGTYSSAQYLSSGLQANQWYHVMLVWDKSNNNIKGYLNGIFKFDQSNTLWPTTMPAVAIGSGFSLDTIRQWNGQIDDVRIYNRALSEDEIKYLYETTYRE
jgi:hypothetical protein